MLHVGLRGHVSVAEDVTDLRVRLRGHVMDAEDM